MHPRVEIFSVDTIDRLRWPENESAQRSKNYLLPFIEHGAQFYVDNADVEMMMLAMDETVIPLVISREGALNSDVCSPRSHFVRYTLEEMARRNRAHARSFIKLLVRGADLVFRVTRLDRAVYVNNWLLPTNPCPELTCAQIAEMTRCLTKRFPDHAIVFPSVNRWMHAPLFDALRENHFQMVAARTIYLFDPARASSNQHKNLKRDRILLTESPYQVIGAGEHTDDDIPRITQLYRDLYLKKHVALNPQFNENFFSLVVKGNTFTTRALKKNGRIDAFVSFSVNGAAMSGNLIGYDLELPTHDGLYRQAFAILMNEASRSGRLLNMSGGAGAFKILRGGLPLVEYQAIYDRHLPLYRRLGWDCVWAGGIFQHVKASSGEIF